MRDIVRAIRCGLFEEPGLRFSIGPDNFHLDRHQTDLFFHIAKVVLQRCKVRCYFVFGDVTDLAQPRAVRLETDARGKESDQKEE